jgi:superfamily I DNA/RNA helicase/RecB family exonuclease
MTESAFYLESARLAAVTLTAGQTEVAALPPASRAVVYGSPGSGKTTALRALFLQLVIGENAQLKPHQVLAIAGSREAANVLRDDLALALEGATAGPMARTLSSFAFQVLRHKALAEGTRAPELISGSEQDRMLAEVLSRLEGADLQALGWPSHITSQIVSLKGFRAELRDLVTVCLEHRITPAQLNQLGIENSRKDWQAASTLLAAYEKMLSEPKQDNRHDASTLLDVASRFLENGTGFTPEVADIRLVLVDDAQELTPSARRLLAQLVSRGAGLVLFGDPDTATLGFRSGDARSMVSLMQEVGETSAKQIVLTAPAGLRPVELSKALGNISFGLPSEQSGLQRRDYVVAREELEPSNVIEANIFNSPVAETAWLARRLRELHILDRVKWGEIAVVARSRATLDYLAAALAAEQVPVTIVGTRKALRDEFASLALLEILQAVFLDEALDLSNVLKLLTSPFCGLDSIQLRRLRRALRRQELEAEGTRNTNELLVALFEAPGSAATIKTREAKIVDRFIRRFFEAKEMVLSDASIEALLWHFWHFTAGDRAPFKHWHELSNQPDEIGAQMNRNLDAITALFAAANRFVERYPEAKAREFVEQQMALDLPEDTLALNYRDDNRVALLTPSALIGKRYRVIALPRLQDGLWPNLKPRTSLLAAMSLDAIKSGRATSVNDVNRNEQHDELRLLHKAVGAAAEKLIVTAVDAEEEQVSPFVRILLTKIPETQTNYNQPRITLRGMVGELRRRLVVSTDTHERMALAFALARLAVEGAPGASPNDWYGLLGVSTNEPLVALDGDDAGQVWLHPSQLENFLTCPLHWFLNSNGGSDSTFEASLGTLMHSVLEAEDGKDESELWQLLEDKWHTLQFEAGWLDAREKRRAKRMFGAMMQYLRDTQTAGTKVLGREVDFRFEYNGAVINGTVDRIEQKSDGSIVIVDLKTSKTATSAEETLLHPQLGLYQLAFMNGAFDHVPGIETATQLDGAKLLFTGEGKVTLRDQPSLETDQTVRDAIEEMVSKASTEMAMPQLYFEAQTGSHCTDKFSYGSCKLHLTKAVTYVG